MQHKTLKHPLPQSLVHIINNDIQRKNATYLPVQSLANKINDKNTTLTQNICSSSQLLLKSMLKYKKISVLLQQLTSRTKSSIKYTLIEEPKKSASAVALLKNQLYDSIKELKISASTVTGVRSISEPRK